MAMKVASVRTAIFSFFSQNEGLLKNRIKDTPARDHTRTVPNSPVGVEGAALPPRPGTVGYPSGMEYTG